jgi:hypothetical protein
MAASNSVLPLHVVTTQAAAMALNPINRLSYENEDVGLIPSFERKGK